MASIFAEPWSGPDEVRTGQRQRDLPPQPDDARMFISEITGPGSEEEFAAGCAELVLPVLSNGQVTASPWTVDGGAGVYLHGFYEGDPSALVSQIAGVAGWSARTLVLQALRNPVGLPGGRTTDCEMPYNKHAIGKSDGYKSCANGHRITDNHGVTRCPVCSKDLR